MVMNGNGKWIKKKCFSFESMAQSGLTDKKNFWRKKLGFSDTVHAKKSVARRITA